MCATQARLSATYSGHVEDKSHVGCNAQAPGMSDALTVKEDHIGYLHHLRKESLKNGPFTK